MKKWCMLVTLLLFAFGYVSAQITFGRKIVAASSGKTMQTTGSCLERGADGIMPKGDCTNIRPWYEILLRVD